MVSSAPKTTAIGAALLALLVAYYYRQTGSMPKPTNVSNTTKLPSTATRLLRQSKAVSKSVAAARAELELQPEDEEIKAEVIVRELLYNLSPSEEQVAAAKALKAEMPGKHKVSGLRVDTALLLAEGQAEKALEAAETVVDKLNTTETAADLKARSHTEAAHACMVSACAHVCGAKAVEALPPPPHGSVQFWGETASGMRTAGLGKLMRAANHLKAAAELVPEDPKVVAAFEDSAEIRKLDAWQIPTSRLLDFLGGCSVYAGRKLDPTSEPCQKSKKKKRAAK